MKYMTKTLLKQQITLQWSPAQVGITEHGTGKNQPKTPPLCNCKINPEYKHSKTTQ